MADFLRPDADSSTGSWTDEGAASTNLFQSVDEVSASDADYAQSSDAPASDTWSVTLSNPTAGVDTGSPVTIRYRIAASDAGTVNLDVALKEGATTIASWSETAISSTATTIPRTLDPAEKSAVSNWDNLSLEFTASAPAGATSILGVQNTQKFTTYDADTLSVTATLGTTSREEIWVAVIGMIRTEYTDTGHVSATIGGNAMEQVFYQPGDPAVSFTQGISFYRYADGGALGTSATLQLNFSNPQNHLAFVVFTTDAASALLDSFGDSSSGATASGSIDTRSDGWAFYMHGTQNSTSGTAPAVWNNSGFIEYGTGEYLTRAYNSPTSGSALAVNDPGNENLSVVIAAISTYPA